MISSVHILISFLYVISVQCFHVNIKSYRQQYDTLNSTFVKYLCSRYEGEKIERSISLVYSHGKFFRVEARQQSPFLQAFYLPASKSVSVSRPNFVVVFSAGWTETFVKYFQFFEYIHVAGIPIFAFDLRGQGFSGHTAYNRGPVTHIRSFDEYVQDLERFLVKIFEEFPSTPKNIIYVGNSLSGLIGLHLQVRRPQTFSRIVLVAPCIKPLLGFGAATATLALRRLGLGSMLISRNKDSLDGLLITHSLLNLRIWTDMRELAPRLKIQGPTVSWVQEVHKAGIKILNVCL